jgi:hypothetical protein
MEHRMPLARYFFYIGGVLLALLLLLDACFPLPPVAEIANANLPVIRIHSERKWPARIVFDTGIATIIPSAIASREANIPSPAAATDVSVKARERQAFAQVQPIDANQPVPSKKRERRLQHPAKIAKSHTVPQSFMAARQMQFGWFGNRIW